jgi:hypothetical protein
VPVPTPDEIRDSVSTDAEAGVSSFTSGDQTTTAMDPEKRLKVADKLAAADALAGSNAYGGPVSGWNRTRAARFVPPGAST